MKDPYEVLGVQRGASDEEIKKAYRAQCKRWHPDLNPGDANAEERFKDVQAAYDAITKGDTAQAPYGAYGGQSAYGGQQQRAQNGYGQYTGYGYSQSGFDPFGFGFDFGGAGFGQQQSGASYSSADTAEMQAARNFIASSRFAEARHVLDGILQRGARWYYLSALANSGLGNSIDALQDARRAVQLEPNNPEYRNLLARLQNPGQAYRTRTQTYNNMGMSSWCFRLILLNLVCNCCCNGGGFYRPF